MFVYGRLDPFFQTLIIPQGTSSQKLKNYYRYPVRTVPKGQIFLFPLKTKIKNVIKSASAAAMKTGLKVERERMPGILSAPVPTSCLLPFDDLDFSVLRFSHQRFHRHFPHEVTHPFVHLLLRTDS
jgi:hypothetical protein